MLNGYGGQMSILGINVDQKCASFSDYVAIMEAEEMRLLESIRGFVS
jgi:predicted double-glycine peptidase